jgi:hypothetical protein
MQILVAKTADEATAGLAEATSFWPSYLGT